MISLKSIERRTFESLIANVLLFIVSFLQNIVLVPLLLANWGIKKYGIWISVYALISMLQCFDVGHQNYIGNEFNKEYYIDKKKAQAVLGSSILFACLIGGACLLFVIVLNITGYADVLIGVKNNAGEKNVGWALVAVMTMWILAGSIGGILVRIILPLGLMARFTYLTILLKLLLFAVVAIGAFFRRSILEVVTIYSIVELLYAAGIFLYIKKIMPSFYPWWKSADIKVGFKNFKKSLIVTFNNLLEQFSGNGILLIISGALTSKAVPQFTTMRTVGNTAMIGSNTFLQSVSADIIRFHAKGEKEKIRTIFYANWFLTGLPINILFLVLPLFAGPIYIWWTKGSIAYDETLLHLVLVSICVANFFKGFNAYLQYINDVKSNFIVISIKAILILTITLAGISKYGLYAPAASYFFAELIAGIFVLDRCNRHFKASGTSFSLGEFSLTAAPILLLTLFYSVLNYLKPISTWMIVFFIMTMFTVYFFMMRLHAQNLLIRAFSLFNKIQHKLQFKRI